jgi:hypothetical protein
MTHVMGFSSSLYEFYIDANGKRLSGHIKKKNTNGRTDIYLDLTPLTGILRNYFSCIDLEGGLLENEGGDGSQGSHWERKTFFNEYMTASDIADARVSVVTLGLLEGTGWY